MEDGLSWGMLKGGRRAGETLESLKEVLREKQRKELSIVCSSTNSVAWVSILGLGGFVDQVEKLEIDLLTEADAPDLCYAPLLWPSLKSLVVRVRQDPRSQLEIHQSWFTNLRELVLWGVQVPIPEFGCYLRSPSVTLERLELRRVPDLGLGDFLFHNTSLRALKIDVWIHPFKFAIGLAKNATLWSLDMWNCTDLALSYIGRMLRANRRLTRFSLTTGKIPPNIEAVVKRNKARLEAACKLLVWARAIGI